MSANAINKIAMIDKLSPIVRCVVSFSLKKIMAIKQVVITMAILLIGMAAELCKKLLFSIRISQYIEKKFGMPTMIPAIILRHANWVFFSSTSKVMKIVPKDAAAAKV